MREGIDGLVKILSKNNVGETWREIIDWLVERHSKSEVGEC